jgi:uncharacterized protein YjbI with pentapeptide repeats
MGWDLSGLDMRGLHLQKANLQGSNLENADLRGVDMSDANLSGVNLNGAKLAGAVLPQSMRLEGLPPQFVNRLKKAGLSNRYAVEEALSEGDEAFITIYGIGPATLSAVKEWLRE